jgi:6-phosphogluconolactonase/glucosamine-6-phosphate isomerase/deaminase
MELREFASRAALEEAGLHLLEEALCGETGSRRGVMLTGGSTPFGVYAALANKSLKADSGVHVFLSDERYVPIDTGDSNYGRMKRYLDAIQVQHRAVVDCGVPPAVAADRYAQSMQKMLDQSVSLPLGILGLGADGHVAALFNETQIARAKGNLAIAVERPDGMMGISLTPEMLCKISRLVFWVCGASKQDAVDALLHRPHEIPAGVALAEARNVELWYSPED